MSVARHLPEKTCRQKPTASFGLRRLTVQRYELFLNPQNFYDITRATMRCCRSAPCCCLKENTINLRISHREEKTLRGGESMPRNPAAACAAGRCCLSLFAYLSVLFRLQKYKTCMPQRDTCRQKM